jgi:hypothetical protein
MWNAEPFIDILERLAPAALREGDREGLRAYLHRYTLDENSRRPVPMTEAGKRLREFTGGFVYDRQAGFLIACAFGEHSRVAAALAQVRRLPFPLDRFAATHQLIVERENEAERFLNEGWGFVVNTPALSGADLNRPWPVRLGPEVSLTAQEKIWFRGFELLRRG